MSDEAECRVGNPPNKPLLIWDGDCHFCRRWIERWRELTGGAVDYVPNQQVNAYPEIPRERFDNSVVLIEPDGTVYFAAEAVFRSLRARRSKRWLTWSYDHVPGFATVTESVYGIVARNRWLGSFVTRLCWGEDVRPPRYEITRRWFLRVLAVVYLIAFVSFWTQADGLVGSGGILPVGEFLKAAQQQLGDSAHSTFPTLCWWNSSNGFLHALCGAGVVFSLLVIFEIAPAWSLLALFVCYLSISIAGQTFLSFQWDILLLETGFLAIFFAPWTLWRRTNAPAVSRISHFLLKFLLFKLMLMSGVVKLTSGDPAWGWSNGWWHWDLATALDYHYWSQPLPTVFAWWADKHPLWFKHLSVAFCLFVEIVVPFFIWCPRRVRVVAFSLLVFLQVGIAIAGNYCFFNLLTAALCLLLLDNSIWRRPGLGNQDSLVRRRFWFRTQQVAAVIVLLITLPLNLCFIYSSFGRADWPRPVVFLYEQVEPFRIASGYGLFRVMTKDRCEIIIEGSADGIDWKPYEFRWKPGDVKVAPKWCAPHQPRLDWQMWFAALGTPERNPWLVRTVVCLLEGKPDVLALFAGNPFPEAPPRFVRASFYRYRFSDSAELRSSGAWWKREELREYLQPVSLR